MIYPLGRKQQNSFVRIDADFTPQKIAEILINFVHPAETTLNQDSDKADDHENIENFIKKNLDDNKFPLIWFYESKDIFQRLFLHTFSNNEIYRSTIRFAKVADPNKETKE